MFRLELVTRGELYTAPVTYLPGLDAESDAKLNRFLPACWLSIWRNKGYAEPRPEVGLAEAESENGLLAPQTRLAPIDRCSPANG